jgi:regulator of replication initiation timing
MKLIKHLLKWRKRTYHWYKKYCDLDLENAKLETRLGRMQERFQNAINHNVQLASENDRLHDRLKYYAEEDEE